MRSAVRTNLLIALLLIPVAFVAGLLALRALRAVRGNTPAEVFAKNESEIRQYVANLRAGKIPRSPDGRGFLVLKVLGDNGVTRVEQNANCTVITFGFMPTDAVPQLWYSPTGFSPLPVPLHDLKGQSKVFTWRQLKDDWGFCEWDN
jgi:hypothetical protein